MLVDIGFFFSLQEQFDYRAKQSRKSIKRPGSVLSGLFLPGQAASSYINLSQRLHPWLHK
jgi:hypothetical protein